MQAIAEAIEQPERPIRKVANIMYTNDTILVPSSYLESPWMHKHIISMQQKASKVLFLVPYPNRKRSYPPNFAHVFQVPVIGVVISEIEKTTLAEQRAEKRQLEEIGCSKEQFFLHLDNIDEIKDFVEKIR
ncbi:hypothetical protein RV15_GL000426 [Enterococcus silesiacus]|uniref:Ethanolamine utilization protein EutP n=1 Tax=Enterococcus silesiacus TaxID=332949 RepID=A0AA91JP72_9ENTE|nr:hypothetical protein RV15_GL000426 [Enterococcus silesiacus]